MNYWIIKAQLTAVELDGARKELLKALRHGARSEGAHAGALLQLQRDWDLLAGEMHKLNSIVERRRAAY